MKYTLHMRNEAGSTETAAIEADTLADAVAKSEAECESWVKGDECGDECGDDFEREKNGRGDHGTRDCLSF